MTVAWYRCFPRDFNEGMVGLTLEERGAYITVLNLIYARNAPIPEDVWWITSQLGCTKRAWVKIRAALILKGKIYAVNLNGVDCLMNGRAASEIAEREDFSKNRAAAGKRGGQNSRPKPNEINDNSEAELKLSLSTAKAIHIHSSTVSPPNGEDTAGKPASRSPDEEAWAEGVAVLVTQGQMTVPSAKTFIGGLLKREGIEARDLLSAIGECKANFTQDPKSYLAAAAKARNRRRETSGPAKRVGWV